MVKEFTNGLGDQGSIPGHIIPKTKKLVLDASFITNQNNRVWIKGKWHNQGKGIASPLTPQRSSY